MWLDIKPLFLAELENFIKICKKKVDSLAQSTHL